VGHEGLQPADYRGIAYFLKFLAEPEQQAWWHRATGYVTITNASLKYLAQTNHFLKNPHQWTAFGQLTSGSNTPRTQGIRLGNFVAVRLAGKTSVKQAWDNAVAKSNEIVNEFASLYK
jgi:sn-glycerol 3-phosphate transport system substrate-binding protein